MKIKLINEGRCFCLYPPEGLKTVLIFIFYEQRCREKLEVIQRGQFQISKASFIKQMHTFLYNFDAIAVIFLKKLNNS